MTYSQLKKKQQDEINAFPIGFAFSNEQFRIALEKWGLTENDTDKLVSIGGGGFIQKKDAQAFTDMIKRFEDELQAEIANDKTGDGFIYSMFNYELANHEYAYTCELEDTLDALDMTAEQIEADPRLSHGLQMAIQHQLAAAN